MIHILDNNTTMDQQQITTMEMRQDKDYVAERILTTVSELMLPITAIIMLFAFINILVGNEKRYFWYWKSQRRSTRVNATADYSKKYVLITGCDKGLGYEMAKKLDGHGFSVIAGCLDVNSDSVRQLKQETSTNLSAVQLDVTSEDDLNTTSHWIRENMNGELWGVVNNAGVCFVGTPEIMAQRDINNIIGVNLQGTINVTKKFLPLIRNSKGRIVNIGSINGDVPMPFFSLYNASKAAVKSLTESLAYELQDWGVKVSLIAPAGFKTGIIMYDRVACANKWWAEASEETRRDHGKDYFTMPMRASARIRMSNDFTPVTNSVVDALTSESPKAIYRVGQFSTLFPLLSKFLPGFCKKFLYGSLLNFISGRPVAVQKGNIN